MDRSTTKSEVRLAATPGSGRLARRGQTLLFVSESIAVHRRLDVDELFERFERIGSTAANYTDVPRCVVDWSHPQGHVTFDSDVDLWEASGSVPIPLQRSIDDLADRPDAQLAVVSEPTLDLEHTQSDLRDGHIHAAAFGLIFSSRPDVLSWSAPHPERSWTSTADTTTVPPAPSDLTDRDLTFAPVGPVSYPADDTQRTFKRPLDVRCLHGHPNPRTNRACRVCNEPLATTAPRPHSPSDLPRAALTLPDGSLISIDQPLVIGRAPVAEAARLVGACRLVPIDGPTTVSRTHAVIQIEAGHVTVTDCDARGRTAVVSADARTPSGLSPWVPRAVAIGDKIQLGGPTTVTIVDRAGANHDTGATASPHQ